MSRRLKHPPAQKNGHTARVRRQGGGVPDLLILRGERLPGGSNPDYKKHESTYTSIVGVNGERTTILECRTVGFRASAVGIEEIKNVWTPISVPKLWFGKPHYLVSNALRVLQACACHSSNDSYPEMKQLRQGFVPRKLLIEMGLNPPEADAILKKLKGLDLLELMSLKGRDVWSVHMTYRAVGPNDQKYTKADLIDDWSLPAEAEVEAADAIAESLAANANDDADGNSRQAAMTQALLCLRQIITSDQSDVTSREVPEGFIQGQPKVGVFKSLAVGLNVSEQRARDLFTCLSRAGVAKSISMGPHPRLVRIKADKVEISADDMSRLRSKDAQSKTTHKSTPKDEALLARLLDVYSWVVARVPEGTAPNEDGAVELEVRNQPFAELIAADLSLSKAQVGRTLGSLRKLKVLEFERQYRGAGFGSKWTIKLGVERFIQRDLDRIRKADRKSSKGGATRLAPSGAAVIAQPTDAKKVLAQLGAKMDEYRAERDKQRVLLAAKDLEIKDLKKQLKTAQAQAMIPTEFPPELLAHLNS